MSIRMALLGLAAQSPGRGGDLRNRFLEQTGGSWPLNIGQVYSTLDRLMRDGLVEELDLESDNAKRFYSATDKGRAEVSLWFAHAVSRDDAPRDELAMKVVLGLANPEVDVRDVIQAQRREVLLAARALAKALDEADGLAERLLIESQLAHVDAEARWLDLTEAQITAEGAS